MTLSRAVKSKPFWQGAVSGFAGTMFVFMTFRYLYELNGRSVGKASAGLAVILVTVFFAVLILWKAWVEDCLGRSEYGRD